MHDLLRCPRPAQVGAAQHPLRLVDARQLPAVVEARDGAPAGEASGGAAVGAVLREPERSREASVGRSAQERPLSGGRERACSSPAPPPPRRPASSCSHPPPVRSRCWHLRHAAARPLPRREARDRLDKAHLSNRCLGCGALLISTRRGRRRGSPPLRRRARSAPSARAALRSGRRLERSRVNEQQEI